MDRVSDKADNIFSQIGNLLRYIAPGFVAIIVLVFVNDDVKNFILSSYCTSQFLIVIICALLIGFALYAIHTTFLGRIFFLMLILLHYPFSLKKCKCYFFKWSFLSELTQEEFSKKRPFRIMFELDTERWNRRADDAPEKIKSNQKELNKWGSIQTFLYCSSYAFIFTPIFVRIFDAKSINCTFACKGIWIGIGLLILALISDWRITNREFWLANPDNKKKMYPK